MSAPFVEPLALSVFGKLPSHADFVHAGQRSLALGTFEDWLTESVEWALVKGGPRFGEAFRGGGMHAFVHRIDARRFALGALAPSRDQAGRQFPLAVSTLATLDVGLLHAPHLLPLVCEGVWQMTSECAASLLSAPEQDLGRIGALLIGPAASIEEAARAYADWGGGLPIIELCTLLDGSTTPQALLDTLRFIAEAARPQRGIENGQRSLALRLPLGAAGGAAVCFWLDAVRRLIGWQETAPSFSWAHDGVNGQMTVHLGAAPIASVSELWLPTDQRDDFCDLLRPLSPAVLEHLPELPGLRALSPTEPVANLLAWLGHSS